MQWPCLEYWYCATNICCSLCISDFENQFRFPTDLPPPEPFRPTTRSYPSKNPRNPANAKSMCRLCKIHSVWQLILCCINYSTHTHTQLFYGSLDFVWNNLGELVPELRRNIHPLTPIVVISHPLSVSSPYYNPWHPPGSVYVLDSLFPQSLSKFSLVYLLAWHPPLCTPYISSPNHCHLLAAHAHTIATCFAAVWRLCHLMLVFQPFTSNSIL